MTGPLTIYGDTNAGFSRTDTYTYPLLALINASNITIANLTFDEGPELASCTPVQLPAGGYDFPCRSTIAVFNASNIVFDRVTLLRSKRHAIEIAKTRNVTVSNSKVVSSGVFGIWTGSNATQVTTNLVLENNLVQDVQSNGMFISFTDSTTIRHNTFIHNHRVALFSGPECKGPCPGGQLDLVENDHVRIESNQFLNGVVDLDDSIGQAAGIEIQGDERDVVITNNEVANNKGAGIYLNPGIKVTNFVITKNQLYGNGLAFWGFDASGAQIFDNCFSATVQSAPRRRAVRHGG